MGGFMNKDTKLSVIKDIIGWKTELGDYWKLVAIQNYMTGWLSEEEIHKLTAVYKEGDKE
jgi:hypothetical protein